MGIRERTGRSGSEEGTNPADPKGKKNGRRLQAEPAFVTGTQLRDSRLQAGRSPRRRLPPGNPGGGRSQRSARARTAPAASSPSGISRSLLCLTWWPSPAPNSNSAGSRAAGDGAAAADLELVVRLRRPRAPALLGEGISAEATGQRAPHGALPLLAPSAPSLAPGLRRAPQSPLLQQRRIRHGQPGAIYVRTAPSAGPPAPGRDPGPALRP